jgi:FlaA1/EpsC-like NDP-sugar epimerase
MQSLKNFNPKYFENKTIMVTGAAGTIGKEICLQLEKTKAKKIIGVDINEYGISVFNLQNKYKSKNKIKLFLLDVSNLIAIKEIFELEKPSIIFHAAANKHVDIVEDNKNYSIYNNLKTIFNVLHLSSRYNFVKRLIFISTDKAVEPSNYMGLTKRVGEILINYFAKKYKKNFTSVRFGNVIGSSGSYIEILKKQIFNGGPITITDKRATRYFMTLNDAVNLVLQSCEEKFIGGVFVLNMGDPINIFNLTKEILKKNNLTIKDKKNLSGDLEVKIIGLKKGEKLFEKLYNSNSKVIKTKNNLIDYEYPEKVNLTKVNKILNYCKSEINDETFKRGNEIIDI